MSEKIMEIETAQFKQEVLGARLAVVDFYSTECPPCEDLATKFEPLSQIYGNDVKFIKIYRQGNRDLAKSLDVSGSPTLLFFKDGQQVGPKLSGGIRRSAIMDTLDAHLPAERVQLLHQEIRPRETITDVAILGGGPAGLTAGIYLAQAHIDTLVIDTALPGGYVATTHQVSNYPGFIDPQSGYMLSHQMTEQAKKNGVKFRNAVEIDQVDLENKTIRLDRFETIRARKIIIATGSKPKALGVKGESEFRGQGISYCATCDAKYYDDKDVIVLGGGNSRNPCLLQNSPAVSPLFTVRKVCGLTKKPAPRQPPSLRSSLCWTKKSWKSRSTAIWIWAYYSGITKAWSRPN